MPLVGIVEHDVDVDRGREEVGHGGRGCPRAAQVGVGVGVGKEAGSSSWWSRGCAAGLREMRRRERVVELTAVAGQVGEMIVEGEAEWRVDAWCLLEVFEGQVEDRTGGGWSRGCVFGQLRQLAVPGQHGWAARRDNCWEAAQSSEEWGALLARVGVLRVSAASSCSLHPVSE